MTQDEIFKQLQFDRSSEGWACIPKRSILLRLKCFISISVNQQQN